MHASAFHSHYDLETGDSLGMSFHSGHYLRIRKERYISKHQGGETEKVKRYVVVDRLCPSYTMDD